MKHLRVTTPFLDSTCSNQKRNVGDVYLCKEERAALLVRNGFCEYVDEETTKREHKNTDNDGHPDGNANETESDVNSETDKSDTKTEKKTTTKKGIKK